MTSNIRPATSDDVRGWYGYIPATMRAIILEVNGEPIAIGGLMRGRDCCTAFMDMKDGASDFPHSLWKATMKAMREIILESKLPVYALVNEELSTAPAFLRRLGFAPVEGKEGVMICQAQSTLSKTPA